MWNPCLWMFYNQYQNVSLILSFLLTEADPGFSLAGGANSWCSYRSQKFNVKKKDFGPFVLQICGDLYDLPQVVPLKPFVLHICAYLNHLPQVIHLKPFVLQIYVDLTHLSQVVHLINVVFHICFDSNNLPQVVQWDTLYYISVLMEKYLVVKMKVIRVKSAVVVIMRVMGCVWWISRCSNSMDLGSGVHVTGVHLQLYSFHLFRNGVLKGVIFRLFVHFSWCMALKGGAVITYGLQMSSISPVGSPIGAFYHV